MRQPKPWFRKQTDTWYVQIGKDQIPLVKGRANEKAAWTEYYRVMAEQAAAAKATEPVKPDELTVAQLCDRFLAWSEKHNEAETFDWHRTFLQAFCDSYGSFKAVEVIINNVTTWLDAHPTWKGGRRHASYCVKRAFSWAFKEGLVSKNPLANVKVGRSGTRGRALTDEERKTILAAIPDQAFRDFITALQETGCRPSEISRVTAADADLEIGVWVLKAHKTAKRTGKPRVVYLTPLMVEMTRRLMTAWPEGPLFRTFRGKKQWKRNAIRCRFMRLRAKLPQLAGVVSYHYRATFATNALTNGVGIAQVAELLGHTGTDMVMRHYSGLSQRVEHMRDAARKATGS